MYLICFRARCDSEDGSMSSSIGKVPRLVEREIIDSSDEESQASSGSFEERMKGDYFVGQVFVSTRMKTNEDKSEVGSVKSEYSGEEEDLEVVREAEAQVSVQQLPPASGNGLPIVSYRMCILCAELSHMQQDCPVEELDFVYVWQCLV